MSATGDCVMDQGGKPQWTGAVDPFDSVTITSVRMNVCRTKFLEEEWRVKLAEDTNWLTPKYKNGRMKVLRADRWVSEDEVVIGEKEFVRSPIAKIPPGGYKMDQYSKSSIQYFEWVSRRDNIKIRHALNGGEIGWTAIPSRLIPLSNTKDASITDAPDVFPRTEKRRNTL